jgi:hypothetical protein
MNGSEQRSFACTPSAGRIAQLNDKLRKTCRGGQVVVTCGVTALPDFDAAELMAALARRDSFDEDNDPHGERDFGDMDLWGAELLWKIDYYDNELTYGSHDPADDSITARVLTVMLAENIRAWPRRHRRCPTSISCDYPGSISQPRVLFMDLT